MEHNTSNFDTLGLPEPLLRALSVAGYTAPTAIQAQAIPAALGGADLMASSQTGSGKTAAFLLPALVRIAAAPLEREAAMPSRPGRPGGANGTSGRFGRGRPGPRREALPPPMPARPRLLVLAPTRELAQQVARAAQDLGRYLPALRVATLVGGVPYGGQLRMLADQPDIVVATPGRLIDHLDGPQHPGAGAPRLQLDALEVLVLDEADRMLDMGFIDDIERIARATPAQRQTLMFSATFDGAAGALAQRLLRSPQRINVANAATRIEAIEQRLHWADDRAHKLALLEHVLADGNIDQALVFAPTQIAADELADHLGELGHPVASLHGGLPQGRRNRVLQGLRERRLRVLVATDVAARGIDVPSITHVVNWGLPMQAEDYVHRIGRTGRAGRSGLAVTLAERRDAGMLARVQRLTAQRFAAAVVPGLEPQRAEPRLHEDRGPQGGGKPYGNKPFGGGAGGKPFGKKPFGAGAGGKPFGKSFDKPYAKPFGKPEGKPLGRRDDAPVGAWPGNRGDGPRPAQAPYGPRAAQAPFGPRAAQAPFGPREHQGFGPKPGFKPGPKPAAKAGGKPRFDNARRRADHGAD